MARDNRIDSIKGLLIILVIMGHVITTFDNQNVVNHAVMGFLYSFHMPLFIFISGYLSKNSSQQSPRDLWRGAFNLFFTLIIFQFLCSLRIELCGASFKAAMEIFPFGVLWYLLSLIYWRVTLYYTPKPLLRRPALYLGIALALSILIGLSYLGNPFALQRSANFFFFFLLGYYFRQGALPARWWNNITLHAIVALVTLPLLFWLFPHCGGFMNGADHYRVEDIPEKILVLSCSTSMLVLLFHFVKDHPVLRYYGKTSMFHYMYHYFIIGMVLQPVIKRYNLPVTFPFVILYTLVILITLYGMSKVKIFTWAVEPVLKRPKKESRPSQTESPELKS